MGMGYAGSYADVIEESELIKLGNCGKLLKKLRSFVSDDVDNILIALAQGQDLNDSVLEKKVYKASENLMREFKKVTGLDLSFGYHDSSNEGDRYDDVDGFFWAVEGMYQLTKAGKKYQSILDRKFFVMFG